MLAPNNCKYYAVIEHEKSQSKRQGLLGVGDDFVVYFVNESMHILLSWPFASLASWQFKKKRLIMEFVGAVKVAFAFSSLRNLMEKKMIYRQLYQDLN